MNKYTKEQLAKKAKKYFDKDKTLKKMLATTDGNFFYPTDEGESFANGHIRTNPGMNLTQVDITRAVVYPKKGNGNKNAGQNQQVGDSEKPDQSNGDNTSGE